MQCLQTGTRNCIWLGTEISNRSIQNSRKCEKDMKSKRQSSHLTWSEWQTLAMRKNNFSSTVVKKQSHSHLLKTAKKVHIKQWNGIFSKEHSLAQKMHQYFCEPQANSTTSVARFSLLHKPFRRTKPFYFAFFSLFIPPPHLTSPPPNHHQLWENTQNGISSLWLF